LNAEYKLLARGPIAGVVMAFELCHKPAAMRGAANKSRTITRSARNSFAAAAELLRGIQAQQR